jgi:soluble lytic murein transglycosylase-like protein
MIENPLRQIAQLTAIAYKLDFNLVCAIIEQETAGNAWLTRFEPAWQYFERPIQYALANRISEATERMMQAMSWGPMQLMGSVAREMGFGAELTRLSAPEYAMVYSCKKLALIQAKYLVEDDVIASWNAGSPRKNSDGTYINQSYVDGVHGFLQTLRSKAP